ncbi:MAG: mercuric reductase [Gemmataceae bacterium]
MTVQVLPVDSHNEKLVDNVHPPDWKNPEPAPRYNLVVIGAGTAGLVSAAGSAGLGARVALIERHLMGGDCLNVGCVPSKGLIAAARVAAQVRDAGHFGVRVPDGVHVDFAAVMERMRKLRADISPNDGAQRFQKLGVDVFLGDGKFLNTESVEVGGQTLRFKKAVIATGGRAIAPPITGLPEAGYLTNETVFSLTERPNRLAVIGAGAIGCELAQSFARFGSKVTLLEILPQIMGKEDPEAVKIVAASLERDGVVIHTSAKINEVRVDGGDKVLVVEKEGKTEEVRVDAILVGAGRAPNVAGLNLEAAGVRYDTKKGVDVNDRLQTSNPNIFAAGDICSQYKFTHAADALARIVIQNALFMGGAKASALTIPWATYTDPEVAHVGLYEAEARAKGIDHRVLVQPFHDVDRAILEGNTEGFVKIVASPKGKILGATIVGSHAGDMISEITVAMIGNVGLGTIAKTIHPYPTEAEAIKKLGDAFNRTKLTPLVKTLFSKWLSWTR